VTHPVDDLRRLDDALAAFAEDTTDLPGVQLMRSSLERRRGEILAAMVDQELDISLARPVRRGTGGELKLVAAVLASLQDSLSSIAQTLTGRPTARGLIPGAIVESVELRVMAASAGSLNLSLLPAFPETQVPLFEDGPESTLDLSVGRLVEVLEHAGAAPAEVLQSLSDLGPRATTHIQALAKTLADASADLTLMWRSPRRSATVAMESVAAAQLRQVIDAVEEEQRTVVFTGRLVGGSLIRATFELELDDGSVVRGPADQEVLHEVEELFGQECAATILIRELRLHTGETKEVHRLTHLTP
jgi:hypothetical protein